MRLEIDWTRCDGHGLCAALLPEAIELDEFGYPIIHAQRVPSGLAARRAVASCPALALRLGAESSRVSSDRDWPASSGRALLEP
jgi:ferredoxin